MLSRHRCATGIVVAAGRSGETGDWPFYLYSIPAQVPNLRQGPGAVPYRKLQRMHKSHRAMR